MNNTKECRICGNKQLETILDLGEQMLTGVFPKEPNARVTSGSLQLVKCYGDHDACGLVQLGRSYDLDAMYGTNYGYRSGLNPSMVNHLRSQVERILRTVGLKPGDMVLDIGSNDSTTLQQYALSGLELVGIDPTGVKFRKFYPSHIRLVADFFSADLFRRNFPDKKAKVITSFSMFYDLERPLQFMKEVYEILADDGIWTFEQSYLPTMLQKNSYDTVCHEHLEYYALRQIKWMTDLVGFTISDVQLNDVNGGSFCVTVVKASSGAKQADIVNFILAREQSHNINMLYVYHDFANRVRASKRQMQNFLEQAKASNKKVAALGASTKGNVILQYCNLTDSEITAIGEVNAEKFGCYTPGSSIPIVPEDEVLRMAPDYLVVLPWHFKKFFVGNKKFANHALVFPLPVLEISQ